MSSEQLLLPPDPEQARLREERRAARMQRRRVQRRAKFMTPCRVVCKVEAWRKGEGKRILQA